MGAKCHTSYTEHRPPSNHQPVTSFSGAAGERPMSCAQILRANSKIRQRKNKCNTVRASRLMCPEALLSLAVLKMYGKWLGWWTRVGALYQLGERLMFYRGTQRGDRLSCAVCLLIASYTNISSPTRPSSCCPQTHHGIRGQVTGGSLDFLGTLTICPVGD